MEKYNDQASKDYFRSTNYRGTAAFEPLFLKRSRIQFLERAGFERVKKSYKCSNCLNNEHTINTCTSNCKCFKFRYAVPILSSKMVNGSLSPLNRLCS